MRRPDALRGILLWEERERRRLEILSPSMTRRLSLARGDGRGITQASMREFMEDVKRRGRLRSPQSKRRADGASGRTPQADVDFDDIWYYIASGSGSTEIADRFH